MTADHVADRVDAVVREHVGELTTALRATLVMLGQAVDVDVYATADAAEPVDLDAPSDKPCAACDYTCNSRCRCECGCGGAR